MSSSLTSQVLLHRGTDRLELGYHGVWWGRGMESLVEGPSTHRGGDGIGRWEPGDQGSGCDVGEGQKSWCGMGTQVV